MLPLPALCFGSGGGGGGGGGGFAVTFFALGTGVSDRFWRRGGMT